MVERIRNEFRRITTGEADGERMSRAELDAYRRQLILLVVSVTAAVLILILGIGAYYQYVHLPRQTVATVNGDSINQSAYWDYRGYELLNQINQYQQTAQFMEGEQSQQYQQLAAEADQEFGNLEGADINPMTVDEMITNWIIMDAIDELGIEIPEEEIDDRVVEFFTGMSISDEVEGPTADPTAEAWATATAEAQQDAQEEAEAELEDLDGADPEDVMDEGGAENSETDNADGEENGENGNTADDAEAGDDGADADADATPEPEPTPAEEEIRATAEATQFDHERFLLDRAGLSHDEFVEMFIVPDIAREKIQDHLADDIPTRDEQVEAAHILVATQDASQVVYEEVTEDDADFGEVAEEHSTDQQTAVNGGDLGWFPRGMMVEEFDEVIFDLEVGEISEPFQSDFGWHIATVTDRDDDRPLELSALDQLRQRAFQDWLDERREAADIETDYDLPDEPVPGQDPMQPPAGAPQPPPPQPGMDPDLDVQQEIPIGDPEAGGPQEIPIGESEADDPIEGDDPLEDVDDDN